jgi:tetratricopeptide (TPR) repeat protein
LEIATELFAIGKILSDIYKEDEKIYYDSYLKLIKAYRKNENFQTAEKHLLKLKIDMKKIMNSQDQSDPNNQLYFFYILSLKELLLLYKAQQMFDFVVNFSDLLEEENLDFFEPEDKLELDMARAELIYEKQNLADALILLENNRDFVQLNAELIEKKIISDYFVLLGKYYRLNREYEKAIENLSVALEILFDIENTNQIIKCSIIDVFLNKIKIFKKLENSEDLLKEEYQNLTKIIFLYLKNPQYLIENEKIFLNPLKNYANFLVQTSHYEEALNISEKVFQILEKCFGLFHKHLVLNFKERANIYYKLKEKKKAINCFKMALEIAQQINDKVLVTQIKNKLEEFNN